MIRQKRPKGDQGQGERVRAGFRAHTRGSQIRPPDSACRTLPSTSHLCPPQHTQVPDQQRLREQEKGQERARGAALEAPAGPARPGAYSLNELQPLLDVGLPSLPLHQSLGERTVHQSVSRGHWPSAPQGCTLCHFHAHPISQVQRTVTEGSDLLQGLQRPLEPGHAAPALTPTSR